MDPVTLICMLLNKDCSINHTNRDVKLICYYIGINKIKYISEFSYYTCIFLLDFSVYLFSLCATVYLDIDISFEALSEVKE